MLLKQRLGISLRYKRDPQGTKDWVAGFYEGICERWSDEVAIVALLNMLGNDYPTEGLPANVVKDMRHVIHERNPE